MTDEKKSEKTVEVELLADGIRLADEYGTVRDYSRGDVVTMSEEHADRLRKHGSVGDKGSVEKAAKAQQERDAAEAKRQRFLQGLPDEHADHDDDRPAQSGPRSEPAPKPAGRPQPSK